MNTDQTHFMLSFVKLKFPSPTHKREKHIRKEKKNGMKVNCEENKRWKKRVKVSEETKYNRNCMKRGYHCY